MISIADSFTGQYRDAGAFMEALAGRLMLQAREQWGRQGGEIVHVMWSTAIADVPLEHPIAAVTISPGDEPITLERLRQAFTQARGPA